MSTRDATRNQEPTPEGVPAIEHRESGAERAESRLDPWDRRLRRAAALAHQHAPARPLLDFYRPIAAFQRDLFVALVPGELTRSEEWREQGAHRAASIVGARVPALLDLVLRTGPPRLAARAAELQDADGSFWTELFKALIAGEENRPTDRRDAFFARVLLQPYAERCRARQFAAEAAAANASSPSAVRCPWCGARPVVGLLRPEQYGARRFLYCALCAAEWNVLRLRCVGCGEARADRLVVYTADLMPHVRVDACETCRRYIKTVDLTRDGLADPVVDELAAVPLDLWATGQGYRKLQTNLLEL